MSDDQFMQGVQDTLNALSPAEKEQRRQSLQKLLNEEMLRRKMKASPAKPKPGGIGAFFSRLFHHGQM